MQQWCRQHHCQAYATTHIGAPGRPTDVEAEADGETSIVLTWTAPASNGSPINHYEIWMWDTTTKQWGWNGVAGAVHNVSHPLTTFTHSPLDAGTQIIYRVRAVNAATNDNNGVGDWSTICLRQDRRSKPIASLRPLEVC